MLLNNIYKYQDISYFISFKEIIDINEIKQFYLLFDDKYLQRYLFSSYDRK